MRPDEQDMVFDSVPDLADWLHVSTAIVYRGLRNGQIPCRRVGRRYVISKAAIQSWLAGGDQQNPDSTMAALDEAIQFLQEEINA